MVFAVLGLRNLTRRYASSSRAVSVRRDGAARRVMHAEPGLSSGHDEVVPSILVYGCGAPDGVVWVSWHDGVLVAAGMFVRIVSLCVVGS
jgi:hypothetical protein